MDRLATLAPRGGLHQRLCALVPPLLPSHHKGSNGRVGVLGGCSEYSGAPFFSAAGSLRSGSDLCHVFTTDSAANVIKGYAPDLMVHSGMAEGDGDDLTPEEYEASIERSLDVVRKWSRSMRCLVAGPGLGRTRSSFEHLRRVLATVGRGGVESSAVAGVVLDADALPAVGEDIRCLVPVRGRCVVTPNAVEYAMLCRAAGIKGGDVPGQHGNDSESPFASLSSVGDGTVREISLAAENDDLLLPAARHVASLAKALGVTVLRKGPIDIIASDGSGMAFAVGTEGSLRRCGGQGDILSGVAGTFMAWGLAGSEPLAGATGEDASGENTGGGRQSSAAGIRGISGVPGLDICAVAACVTVRECARVGFRKHGRALQTSDMLELVGPVFRNLFEPGGFDA